MSNFFQLFVAWGVLLLVLLCFYLIDKVNTIYRNQIPAELPPTYSDGLFGELSGKKLWDAMSGIPIAGVDPQTVLNLKPHYEPVLRQHIEQTFWEGYHAGKQGQSHQPSNKKMIPTPRGGNHLLVRGLVTLSLLASVIPLPESLLDVLTQDRLIMRLQVQHSLRIHPSDRDTAHGIPQFFPAKLPKQPIGVSGRQFSWNLVSVNRIDFVNEIEAQEHQQQHAPGDEELEKVAHVFFLLPEDIVSLSICRVDRNFLTTVDRIWLTRDSLTPRTSPISFKLSSST